MSESIKKWISLHPTESIYLKAIPDGSTHFIMVIDGLTPMHTDYGRAKKELGFQSVPDSGLLFQRIPRNAVKPSFFRPVWPQVSVVPLSSFERSQYLLTRAKRDEIVQLSQQAQDQAAQNHVATPLQRNPQPQTQTPSRAPASTPNQPVDRSMGTWIDLQDPDGVMLKAGKYNDRLTLVLEGVTPGSVLFNQIINELHFVPSPEGRYLIKTHPKGTLAYPQDFHSVWPNAKLAQMPKKDYAINFSEKAKRLERQQQRAAEAEAPEGDESQEDQGETLHDVLTNARYLGRNTEGDRVYTGVIGRFYVSEADEVILEDESKTPTLFLRSRTVSELKECAKGLIISCLGGESYRLKELNDFAATVLDKNETDLTEDDRTIVSEAIHDATMAYLLEDMPSLSQLSPDATYLYEMMPGLAQFQPDIADSPLIPTPIALHVQRYLEPAKQVHMTGHIPSVSFGLLPENTEVFLPDTLLAKWENDSSLQPQRRPISEQSAPSHAAYTHINKYSQASETESLMTALEDGGLAVVTVSSVDGSKEMLGTYGDIIQAIEIPSFLTHTPDPFHLYLIRRGEPNTLDTPTVKINSWDNMKSIVDETLRQMGRSVQAATPTKANSRTDNRYQRPYMAFSKIGPSSTMVPQNLQSAVSSALAKLQEQFGDIDEFVSSELGITVDAMAERFSPEQIDAVGLVISRMIGQRGFILGDETGLGKGRTIAAAATWANRSGKKIVFVTDRSNLFSDLARDLIDIDEWERFRPLITNSDGEIIHMLGDGESLAKPLTRDQFQNVVNNGHNANIIFTTYSQMNQLNSVKSNWLIEQSKDALLILDESHIAAGENSNITQNIIEMVRNSSSALYSSATWAKSLKSLSIYSKALPESVNHTQIAEAFENEGESFSEVFATMLAMDGSFLRREHDLSKIDFVLDSADPYTERNIAVTDSVIEVLGMMALLSGDINSALQRMNKETRRALMNAKTAHQSIQQASRLQIARREEAQLHLEQSEDDLAQLRAIEDPDEQTQEEIERAEHLLEQARLRLAQFESENTETDGAIPNAAPSQLFTSSFGTGGAIYQVMRRTQAALLTDYVGDRVIEGLEKGQRPIVVFSETGENFVNQFIDDEHERLKSVVQDVRNRLDQGQEVDSETLAQSQEIAAMLDSNTRSTDIVKHIRVPTLADMMRGLLIRLGGVRVSNLEMEIDETPPPSQTEVQNEAPDSEAIDTDVISDTQRNMPVFIERTELVSSSSIINLPNIEQTTIDHFMQGVEAINEKINELPALPIIPIDALRMRLEKEGISIGEISGRQYQLDPVNKDANSLTETPVRLIRRDRKKTDTIHRTKQFNDGEIDVIAINEAGATGLSLHASPRFGNSNQRLILEWQPSADPSKRSQLFGRGNRFDQVVPPEIATLTSNVPSENRAIMMNNKKFSHMSATIRSSRENAVVNENIPDMINRTGDRVVQEYLLDNPGIASRIDISSDRLAIPYGLSNFVFQRLSLLPSTQYVKVFEDLQSSYEDALIENEISLNGDTIETKDWRAQTHQEKLLWGPEENVDELSAFEGPVYLREVHFERDFNPIRWDEVNQRIKESATELLNDPRVKRRVAEPFSRRYDSAEWGGNERVQTSPDEKIILWQKSIINAMHKHINESDMTKNPRDVAARFSEDDSGQLDLASQRFSNYISKFDSIAGKTLPIHVRLEGTSIYQHMVMLVSRSARTAKLWCLQTSKEVEDSAEVFFINLDRVLKDQLETKPNYSNAFKQVDDITGFTADKHWARRAFNALWESNDPEVPRVDLRDAIKRASLVLEAKKITALSSTGVETIEEALALPDDNAVKESHWRKLFVENILSRLAPGVMFQVSEDDRRNPLAAYFNAKPMLIVGVQLPATTEEASLSKWKFHAVSPGSEKTTILSGAMIYKMSKPGQSGLSQIRNIKDIYDPLQTQEKKETAHRYNSYQQELISENRHLLVGNSFQAGEWARSTKNGQPIIYTDQDGSPHRAIEIMTSDRYSHGQNEMLAELDTDSFPKQVSKPEIINRLLDKIYEADSSVLPNFSTQSVYAYRFSSTFNASLAYNPHAPDADNSIILMPEKGILMLMMKRDERDKYRRQLRSAVVAEKKEWARNNPEQEDLLELKTRVKRTSDPQGLLVLTIPSDKEARHRFINALSKSNGFTIYVSKRSNSQHAQAPEGEGRVSHSLYEAACQVEREYYRDYAQQIQDQRLQLRELHAERLARQTMLSSAVAHVGNPAQLTLGAETLEEGAPEPAPIEQEPIPSPSPTPVVEPLDLSGFPAPMSLDASAFHDMENPLSETPVRASPSQY